jgi:hypothetical protein
LHGDRTWAIAVEVVVMAAVGVPGQVIGAPLTGR